MPYGQFAVDSTRIAQRRIAAIQPFIQEAGALEQVAIAQAADQNAAAAGALIGEVLIDILDAAADAGAFRGGYHNHHGTWHGVTVHPAAATRYRRPAGQ
jgi:hypothetical protein